MRIHIRVRNGQVYNMRILSERRELLAERGHADGWTKTERKAVLDQLRTEAENEFLRRVTSGFQQVKAKR